MSENEEAKETNKEINLMPEIIESKSNKALISGIDVLRGTELIKPEDFEFLHGHINQYEKRFKTRAIFRSKTEMIAGVLNDSEHPTVDSKYWQAIGEQNVHLTELISLSYEAKKLEADNELLEAEIEDLEYQISMLGKGQPEIIEGKKLEAKMKRKRIELAQAQFNMTQQQKTAQERLREVKTWEPIIEELEQHLEFGSEDFEAHHAKRYYLRYKQRYDQLEQLDPEARESVTTHMKSFAKMAADGGSPLPIEMSLAGQIAQNQEENKQVVYNKKPESEEVVNTQNFNRQELPNATVGGEVIEFPDGSKSESHNVNFPTKESMMDADPISAGYFARKVRKILVCTPHRAKEDTNVTNFFSMQPPAAFDCSIEEPYGLTVPDARNYCVKLALEQDIEYIFFVDDDTLIPRNALVQLIHHKADVVGGFYYRKYLPLESVGMFENADGVPSILENYKIGDIINNTLVLPSGCTLIRTEVFKKMEYPYYRTITVANRPTLTEDTFLCQKLRDIGCNIITDTGVQCLHIDRNKGVLYGHPDIIDYKRNEIKPQWRDYFAV